MSLREKAEHRVLSCTLLGVGDAPLLPPSLPMGRMASRWWAAWLPWPEMALWSSMALRWLRRSRLLALGFAPSLGRDIRPILAYLQAGCAPISTPVFRQWWHWFRRREGRLAELPVSSVASPVKESERVRWLLVAGDADPMAPLEAIYRLQAQIPDAQAEILQLPESPALHGGSYSHLDLLLSPSLAEELFPRWLAWLQSEKIEEKQSSP
jgi:pimeloyl-ACP methyl ester carboxylesterase